MKILITSVVSFLFTGVVLCQTANGVASYYDDKFEGRPTASGEIFDQGKYTAAHRSLAFGTLVKVTNVENKKSVTVTINDRGPFAENRLIDVSKSAAKALDFIEKGLTDVQIEVVKEAEVVQPKQVTGNIQMQNASTKISQGSNELRFPNEYYELDINFAKPTGYVVQVGSFTELANLMRMAQELRRIYGKNLLVQVTDLNEKKVHRLLVGPFSDRLQAEKMQQNLKSNFTDCFVVEVK